MIQLKIKQRFIYTTVDYFRTVVHRVIIVHYIYIRL